MFPFASIFTRSYQPDLSPRRAVLDEEYEWVFGNRASHGERSSRVDLEQIRNRQNRHQ